MNPPNILPLFKRPALPAHPRHARKTRSDTLPTEHEATRRLTLAAGDIGEVVATAAPDAGARARVADARACLAAMGGRFTRRTDTEFLLELPVVTSPQPSLLAYRHV